MTAEEVLRRYESEDIPAFVGKRLTDVNQVGNFGERPLDVACVRGLMEEIEALLEGGADINGTGEFGMTPLHEAVSQNHLHVVAYLLQKGARADLKNEWGQFPIDMAKLMGRAEIVEILQRHS